MSKLHELFEKIYSAGWAKSEDFERLLDAEKDEERKQKILDAALLKNPSSSKFWLEKIHYAIQTENANIDKIKDIFNEALQFVRLFSLLHFYLVKLLGFYSFVVTCKNAITVGFKPSYISLSTVSDCTVAIS